MQQVRAFEEWCMGQTKSLHSSVAELKQSQDTRDQRIKDQAASIDTISQRVAELEKKLADLRIQKRSDDK